MRTAVEELIGKTIINIERHSDEELVFTTADQIYLMHHIQDCCEEVRIEDIIGNLDDLIGTPILMAEEATSAEDPPGVEMDETEYTRDSFTWTFYKFATVRGYVTIRWYGESNGYYSEDVQFEVASARSWQREEEDE